MCMMTEPSPSRQTTRRFFFCSAIPRAIEDACPIDPTVRKSLSCPSSRFFLSSNNSLAKVTKSQSSLIISVMIWILKFFFLPRQHSSGAYNDIPIMCGTDDCLNSQFSRHKKMFQLKQFSLLVHFVGSESLTLDQEAVGCTCPLQMLFGSIECLLGSLDVVW